MSEQLEKYTFANLFGKTIVIDNQDYVVTNIEIPRIQRDYAQGRKTKEVNRVRARFLDALYNAITKPQPITLDFVYGDVENGKLTPLDGQQRLTTLFLLHWYVARKEKINADESGFLNHFSYATRFSSRDFCLELVKNTIDFAATELSTEIQNQSWYPYEWENDPTINSMLVMIDAINDKFRNEKNLWKSLVIDQNIGFYFLPIREVGLTDDLYIKMNSRGKPLTEFEHFKAEFEEIIKAHSEDLSKEFNHKFDIEWTDMLFPYRGDNNIIDDEFMRYFKYVSHILCYLSDIELKEDEFELAKMLYSKDALNALDNLNYLKSAFDCWCKVKDIDSFFSSIFSSNKYESGKVKIYQDALNIFKECCDNYVERENRIRAFPLRKMLLLYAILTYLQNREKISEEDFRHRIRVIRNLIWNSSFEIRERDQQGINQMKRLIEETKKIVCDGVVEKDSRGFNVSQKKEEVAKINWLNTNTSLAEDLFHLEDHNFLFGSVFIIGLDHSDNFTKFRLLFNNCSKDNINRALLCLGDYSQKVSSRYQLGSQFNDSSWIDLFHPTKQREGFKNISEIINALLSQLDENNINDTALQEIIKTYLNDSKTPKDWRYYLIKYSEMREGRFGMYYWEDKIKPYECIMMNTEKSIRGRNWDIFSYTILKKYSGKGLTLGDNACQGDKLQLNDKIIECLNDKFVVTENGVNQEYSIPQTNGIDNADRIEQALKLISNL